MSEVSIQDRNTNTLTRIFLTMGGAGALASLFLLPQGWPMFLFFLVQLAGGAVFHFTAAKKDIVLLALDGDTISYTSRSDPVIGIGGLYELPGELDIDTLHALSINELYIRDAGSFQRIELFERNSTSHVIWLESGQEEGICTVIKEILDTNPEILIVDSEKNTSCNLDRYQARIREKLSGFPEKLPWEIETSSKGRFSEEEWQQILLVPVCIFNMVARADGEIEKSEISVFVDSLHQAEQYNSFFVAEIFTAALDQLDLLVETFKSKDQTDRELIKSVQQMLDNRIEEVDRIAFRQALLELGDEISTVRKQKSAWSRHKEQYVLQEISQLLGAGMV